MFAHVSTMDTHNSSPLTTDFNFTTVQMDQRNHDLFDPFNNPWNLISAAARETVTRIVDYVYIVFVIVGIPANIINCLVFYRQVGLCVLGGILPLRLILLSSLVFFHNAGFNATTTTTTLVIVAATASAMIPGAGVTTR